MTPRRGPAGGPGDRARHIPVLPSEMLSLLAPRDGETYIDGTFGAGGTARSILEAAQCRVVAFDRDPEAVRAGSALVREFEPRLELIQASFGDMAETAVAFGLPPVDGVVLDVGVSSMQLDDPERGFSFQSDGPLDMRMSRTGPSAADVVNSYEADRLADIIHELGEERRARAIARAVVVRRADAPFTRTGDLARLVAKVARGGKSDGKHPATRTFQALRIYVNDELGELERGLKGAERVLKPGGRLVVVTFHSLEDRIVKRFLAARSGKAVHVSRHVPERSVRLSAPSFRIVNRRPLTPSKDELDVNPRARSARLRAGERTDAPPWPASADSAGRSSRT